LSPNEIEDLIVSDPAEVENSSLPITPVERLHTTGVAPEVDIVNYRLTVDGLVEVQLTLTYDAIMEYPTVSKVVLLVCPDFFVDNAEWTGVPMTTLLSEVDIKPQATQVAFYALDGYKRVLPIEEVRQDGVFLAHTVNGQILPDEHGYPLRLVVKGKYGDVWVKWVEHIEVI
jgi:sulfoxide reductase catalytic subunit YedY